jgi:phosphohistidine phosphatase
LLLLRHGKSEWGTAAPDHDRPLGRRGKRDVPRMAAYARRNRLLPDVVLSSTACRARQTADLFVASAECCRDAVICLGELYLATAQEIWEVIRAAPAEARSVMVVGHNPGMEDLVRQLAGSAFPAEKFPTAALACFEIAGERWADACAEGAVLVDLAVPKALGKHAT